MVVTGRGTKYPEKGTTLKVAVSFAVWHSISAAFSSKFEEEEQQNGSLDSHTVWPELLNPSAWQEQSNSTPVADRYVDSSSPSLT